MSDKLLYDVRQASELTSVGRTKLFEEMASGRLPSVLVGRKRLIPAAALSEWVERLRADTAEAVG